jgi:hypothetical protein
LRAFSLEENNLVPRQLAYFFLLASLIAGCAGTPSHSPDLSGKTEPRDEGEESTGPVDHRPVFVGNSDVFRGTDRRDAKTSLASGGIESYALIANLRSTLRTDEYMQSLGISQLPDSRRSVDEQRNVRVRAFIYAVKKESDNDFHVIVGDQHCRNGGCLITVEVSGIPAAATHPNRKALTDVRAKFLAHFSGYEPGRSRYAKLDPPIHVTLTGSLFFDVDHKAGMVGPAGLKSDTAWEMHPLSDITFEP